MSKVKTDLGKHSALFYFEDMECWHVSGRMKNPKNSFCWLFCKSTGGCSQKPFSQIRLSPIIVRSKFPLRTERGKIRKQSAADLIFKNEYKIFSFLAMHPLEIKEQWWNEAHDNPAEQSGKHGKKANKLGFKVKAANIIISHDDKK